MTSQKQDAEFKKAIAAELPASLMGTALDFIRDNLNPDQVFDQARLNRFVGDVAKVEDVFDEKDLQQWAEEHGYIKQNIFLEA